MANKVLVLAENYEQLQKYVKINGLNMKHFDYLIGSEQFRGYQGAVILLGHWWRNRAYGDAEFKGILHYRKATGSISLISVKLEDDNDFHLQASLIVPPPLPSTPQLAYS